MTEKRDTALTVERFESPSVCVKTANSTTFVVCCYLPSSALMVLLERVARGRELVVVGSPCRAGSVAHVPTESIVTTEATALISFLNPVDLIFFLFSGRRVSTRTRATGDWTVLGYSA